MTGGHAGSTAHAVIEEIIIQKKNWKLFFAGSKYAIEGKQTLTYEASVLEKMRCTFVPLISGRIQRKFTIWTIPSLLKIPIGFIHSLIVLFNIKPDVILSFGGYASFPIVFWGKFLGIPVILHEQTVVIGRSNLIALKFASEIALSRESSKRYIGDKKYCLTGNPILKGFCIKHKKHLSKVPTIFITGGSRGSQIINDTVFSCKDILLRDFRIIHQTGSAHKLKMKKLRDSLSYKQKQRYEVHGFLNPDVYLKKFLNADIVISRAGANTVSQIIASSIPSILIPIPFSYRNEQFGNADYINKHKGCIILNQTNLSSDSLVNAVYEIKNNWSDYRNNLLGITSIDCKAAEKLVKLIDDYINYTLSLRSQVFLRSKRS